jgi:AcrR family transcriptional regulator
MPRVSAKTKEANREKLLLAAADEFAREGVSGANINNISLSAGLAKGTVYNYFDSKDALFLEVVRESCARAADEVVLCDDATTAESLLTLLRTDVAWVKKHPAFARVMQRELFGTDPERYQAVIEATAPFLARTEAVLERGQARGEVRTDRPCVQLALVLGGLMELAYAQHWGSQGAWPTLDEIPALVVDQFLGGAAPRAAPVLTEDAAAPAAGGASPHDEGGT